MNLSNLGIRSAVAVLALLVLVGLPASNVSAQSNPVPLINQPLVPDRAIVGNKGGIKLAVNGAGFVSASVVQFNGAPLVTTFVNGSQLTAAVPASDLAVAGTASIVVVNPRPGGGPSNTVYFPISPGTQKSVSYAVGSSFPAGNQGITAGDFNGDGKADVATTNVSANTASVLLGNGDGTFQSALTSPTGPQPFAVGVGDFNHDGKLDAATANENGAVSILIGNGDGTFKTNVDYPAGDDCKALTVGDFNGDGNLDVAVTNSLSNTLSILLGNGDGTFQPHVDYATGSTPLGITAADFNGDGKLDLAVANSGETTVSILLGNGDGTFQAQQTVMIENFGPGVVLAADFNGDGKLDLAVTDQEANATLIALGNGDGTFQTRVGYTGGGGALVAGDFNGDGKLDLVGNFTSSGGEVETLLGKGDGTFRTVIGSSASLFGLVAADFNGDGRLDVAGIVGSNVVPVLQTTLTLSSFNGDFGNQTVGTTSPARILTLRNLGSAPITFTSITTSGPFGQKNTCGASLAAGATCSIAVTFSPTMNGGASGTLTIVDSAIGSPQTESLSGTGTGPGVQLSPTSLTFAPQKVGTTSLPQNVTLTNTGTGTLLISSVATTGDFAETNSCGGSLLPNQDCTIIVTFTPTQTGTRTGSVAVTDNAPGSPQMVSLSGTGE